MAAEVTVEQEPLNSKRPFSWRRLLLSGWYLTIILITGACLIVVSLMATAMYQQQEKMNAAKEEKIQVEGKLKEAKREIDTLKGSVQFSLDNNKKLEDQLMEARHLTSPTKLQVMQLTAKLKTAQEQLAALKAGKPIVASPQPTVLTSRASTGDYSQFVARLSSLSIPSPHKGVFSFTLYGRVPFKPSAIGWHDPNGSKNYDVLVQTSGFPQEYQIRNGTPAVSLASINDSLIRISVYAIKDGKRDEASKSSVELKIGSTEEAAAIRAKHASLASPARSLAIAIDLIEREYYQEALIELQSAMTALNPSAKAKIGKVIESLKALSG